MVQVWMPWQWSVCSKRKLLKAPFRIQQFQQLSLFPNGISVYSLKSRVQQTGHNTKNILSFSTQGRQGQSVLTENNKIMQKINVQQTQYGCVVTMSGRHHNAFRPRLMRLDRSVQPGGGSALLDHLLSRGSSNKELGAPAVSTILMITVLLWNNSHKVHFFFFIATEISKEPPTCFWLGQEQSFGVDARSPDHFEAGGAAQWSRLAQFSLFIPVGPRNSATCKRDWSESWNVKLSVSLLSH